MMEQKGLVLKTLDNVFCFESLLKSYWASLVGQVVKNLPANAGDSGLIPGLGRSPREGNGSLLQFHSLENSMDRGAKWAVQSKGSQRVGHS